MAAHEISELFTAKGLRDLAFFYSDVFVGISLLFVSGFLCIYSRLVFFSSLFSVLLVLLDARWRVLSE